MDAVISSGESLQDVLTRIEEEGCKCGAWEAYLSKGKDAPPTWEKCNIHHLVESAGIRKP